MNFLRNLISKCFGVKFDDLLKIRIGNGIDFHKFAQDIGEFKIPIGGVYIPFKHKIIAHSDGDVALHSICDAIFGGLANGNIGSHFPPSDERWKGVSSEVFLSTALELLKNSGGILINIDVTIICEDPKIMPFYAKIKKNLARITGLPTVRISIKAVTTEQMGFLGRKEGVGAIATVLLYVNP